VRTALVCPASRRMSVKSDESIGRTPDMRSQRSTRNIHVRALRTGNATPLGRRARCFQPTVMIASPPAVVTILWRPVTNTPADFLFQGASIFQSIGLPHAYASASDPRMTALQSWAAAADAPGSARLRQPAPSRNDASSTDQNSSGEPQ
jgi:hypothetical protein